MSEGVNRVTLLGNLGADPEIRATKGGQSVLTLRIATTESFKDGTGVRKERTDWHRVVVWGGMGESLGRLLQKGEKVLVEGRITTRSYEDAQGRKVYQTDITATNVVLCGGQRGSRAVESGSPLATEDVEQPWSTGDDRVPF